MNIQTPTRAHLNQPQAQTAFRNVKWLVGGYLGLSILTLVAIVLLRDNSTIVTPAVWVRGIIVTASGLLTVFFTVRMVRGSRVGYLGLRLESAIMFVAIVVIIALPGLFPLWMRIEQGACGLLLLGVVMVVNSKHLRSAFAAK